MRWKLGGTHSADKIGFFGAEPVGLQTVGTSTITTAATSTTPWGFATSTQADNLAATVRLMRTALSNYGMIV